MAPLGLTLPQRLRPRPVFETKATTSATESTNLSLGTIGRSSVVTLVSPERSHALFLFFSNRLGCFGSIAITVIGTLILLYLLGWM